MVASVVALPPSGEHLTFADAAARAGMTMEKAVRIWRAGGIAEPGPDDRVYMEGVVGVFRIFATARS